MTQTEVQCDIVCISFRGHNSAIMSWIKKSFSLMHMFNAQCMPELCCKFQIPTSNTVGVDAETRTVLQCDMVKNMSVIQGDVILQ